MEVVYMMAEEPGEKYAEDGTLERLVTAAKVVVVKKRSNHENRDEMGEAERFLPLLLQSCMNPQKGTIYPVILEKEMEKNEEYVKISVYQDVRRFLRKDIEIMYEEFVPEPQKKGCFPCRNCGRC